MYALTLKAELEGYVILPRHQKPAPRTDKQPNSHRVTNLRPKDTQEAVFFYTFRVQCTSCRETHPNPVAVSRFVRSS